MKESFKLIGAAIVVLVAVVTIIAYVHSYTEIISDFERLVGSDSESTVYKISAYQLFKEYESNVIAADQKYKGKILEVDGIVREIGKDFQGSLYLVLTGADIQIIGVQCYFSTAHANALALVRKGERITVKGKCSGYFLLGPDLKGCKII